MADGDAQQVVDRRLVLEQVGLRREEPREPAWESNFGRVVPVTASARRRSGDFHTDGSSSAPVWKYAVTASARQRRGTHDRVRSMA